MEYLQSLILGIVQGITEFLPISSTGHLILTREVLGLEVIDTLAFDAILHLATAFAVIIYFHKDIRQLTNTVMRKMSRLPVDERELILLYALAAGTVPAVILGLSLESLMETMFRNPLLVAAVLVGGSLLFMYAEWVYENNVPQNEMNVKKAFKIGLFQSLALIPGMSRSGAAIAGGMLLGLTRHESARFSFLLAIPLMLGAGSKKMLELIRSGEDVAWVAIAIGASVAFMTGLMAVHFMLSFVRKHSLWPFIWYRIILAGFVVFVVVFG